MSAVTPFDWWTKFKGTAFEGRRVKVQYDFDGETDGKPKYVGMARAGVANDANGWIISRFTYDASRCMTLWVTSNENVKWTNRDTTVVYDLPDPT